MPSPADLPPSEDHAAAVDRAVTAEVLEEYRDFLAEVDRICARLVGAHAAHLQCRKGCSECCTDISVLPVEAESLRMRLREEGREGRDASSPRRSDGRDSRPDACPLLSSDGACSVYAARPLICRTHGLPLLYPVLVYDETGLPSDEDEDERLLTWCDLNFRGVSRKRIDRFPEEDLALDMESLNLRLESLNARFLETPAGQRCRAGHRVSMREIARSA